MGLRVYLIDNDGKTSFIDYGLEGKNYKGILKTEIREELSKVKTYSGSKFVGIPEIDNPVKSKKKTKIKSSTYEIFNYKVHDTDREYFWVSAICSNCKNNTQVAIPQKTKINKKGFKGLFCSKCGCENTLSHAKWDGKKYVKVMN